MSFKPLLVGALIASVLLLLLRGSSVNEPKASMSKVCRFQSVCVCVCVCVSLSLSLLMVRARFSLRARNCFKLF